MKFRENAKIIKADKLATGVYEICFDTKDIAKNAIPGQFISVYSNHGERLLPRPISICGIDGNVLRIVYRVVGAGTDEFSKMKAGESLTIQGPLGNGYELDKIKAEVLKSGREFKKALLFGGGIGIPPMLELAKSLDIETEVVLGYRDSENFLKDEFEKCANVHIATDDGSVGFHGNVVDAAKEEGLEADVIFACGPLPMLKGVKAFANSLGIKAYISLEEKMACGIGACLACVSKTHKKDEHSQVNNARICMEGPVFDAAEVEI